MKKFSATGLIFIMSVFVINCGSNSSSSTAAYPRFSSTDNEMVNFSFPVSKNSTLSGDVTGTISDSVITLNVPSTTDLTSLIAEFTTNSSNVTVNGTTQSSGVTSNNFSNQLEYTITAENGDKRVYSIVVIKALSGEKSLTAFSLNGITGVIDQTTGAIAVELPARTLLNSIKASFSSAGKSVAVGDVVQISGETSNNFSTPVKYIVTAEDGSKKEYNVSAALLKDTAKEFIEFGFKKSENPSLSSNVQATFSGDEINVVLPYGSNTDRLIAFYDTYGATVKVNDVIQTSKETVNNFSSPVNYSITAEDGSVHTYAVNVNVAKSDAKAITQYILDGESGVVNENEKTINVVFPSTKDLSNLKASFVTSGVQIAVADALQESGVTVNNFSSPVVYKVTADDDSIASYTVTVEKTPVLAGIWNFEYGSDGSYTVSGATVTDGVLGNALHFNKGNYVLVPDSEFLTLASEGTIEAVINADSHQPFAGVVHKGVKTDFSDESYSLQFWGKNGTDGTLRFSVFNNSGGNAYVESSTKLATGTWYYVSATWNAAEIKLYVNGNLEDSIPNTIGNVRDSSGALIIGAQLPVVMNSYYSNLVFNGIVDRVQIHSRALTDTEISDNYRGMPFASWSTLTAYILAVAAKNYTIIGGIFGILVMVLLAIFLYNRKNAGSSN